MTGNEKIDWNYAALSKMAKENGGPEELIRKIVSISFSKGMREGNKNVTKACFITGVACATITGLTCATIVLVRDKRKKKEELKAKELAESENQLINGIYVYDETHNEEMCVTPNSFQQ